MPVEGGFIFGGCCSWRGLHFAIGNRRRWYERWADQKYRVLKVVVLGRSSEEERMWVEYSDGGLTSGVQLRTTATLIHLFLRTYGSHEKSTQR